MQTHKYTGDCAKKSNSLQHDNDIEQQNFWIKSVKHLCWNQETANQKQKM